MRLPDEVWIDDVVRWAAWGAGLGVSGFLVCWMLIGYGEYRMSNVALQAQADARWCASLIEPLLSQSERALHESSMSAETLQSYLTPQPEADQMAAVE